MVKKFIAFLSLFLALAYALPAYASDNGKSSEAPRRVGKITLIHYVKGAKPDKPDKAASLDKYKLLFPQYELKWADTMQYEVNYADSGLDGGSVMTAITNSLKAWDDVTSFELFGTPGITPKSGYGRDNENVVSWSNLDSRIIAVNHLWFDIGSQEILESDVEFNSSLAWGLDGNAEEMDLQNIATHEFGHNGLSDLYSRSTSELTMYGYSSEGDTDKRTLEAGDIAGFQKLYGAI